MAEECGARDAKLGKAPSPPFIYREEEEDAYFESYWEVRVRFFYINNVLRIS